MFETLIYAIEGIGALIGPLESLLKAAYTLWNDMNKSSNISAQQLVNDADGAAQAAVELCQHADAQVKLVADTIQANQPSVSREQALHFAAAAVAKAKADKAKADKTSGASAAQ